MDLKKYLGYIGCAVVVLIVFAFAAIWSYFQRGETQKNPQIAYDVCGTIPSEYKKIFNDSGNRWKVKPAFLAAIFYAGEHGNSWPKYEEHAALGTSLNPKPHNCDSDVGCIRGPMQIGEKNWPNWTSGAYDGKQLPIERIEWTKDAIDVAAWHLAVTGAGGNTTDLDKLRDAASIYNSGRPWSKGQNIQETNKYVKRVIEAYQNFECSVQIAGLENFSQYYLSQRDYGSVIENDGCKATTRAMMLNYILGKPNAVTVPYSYGLSGNKEAETKGPGAGKVSLIELGASPPLSKIECYLNNKIPVAVGANSNAVDSTLSNSPRFTSRTHWVVVTGIDGKQFNIADPYFTNRTRFSWQALLDPNASIGAFVYVPVGKENMCQ